MLYSVVNFTCKTFNLLFVGQVHHVVYVLRIWGTAQLAC